MSVKRKLGIGFAFIFRFPYVPNCSESHAILACTSIPRLMHVYNLNNRLEYMLTI